MSALEAAGNPDATGRNGRKTEIGLSSEFFDIKQQILQ
jgi:hypothetical protein